MRKKDFTFVQNGYMIVKINMKFVSYEKGDSERNGERETTDEGTAT